MKIKLANKLLIIGLLLYLAAGIAAILPGFLEISGKILEITIRAGGAIAVFVLVYKFNPPKLLHTKIDKEDHQTKELNDLTINFTTINVYNFLDGLPESKDSKIKKLFNDGHNYFVKEQYALAIEKFKRILGHEKDPSGISAANIQIGHCYYNQKSYLKAAEYFGAGLHLAKQACDSEGIAASYGNIALTYLQRTSSDISVRSHNICKAVELLLKTLKYFSIDEYPVDYAMTQNNLGTAYTDLPSATSDERAENVRKAIKCYQAALEIYKKDEYSQGYCFAAANLGMILIEINDKRGCYFLKEAYSLCEYLPDQGKGLEEIIQENCHSD